MSNSLDESYTRISNQLLEALARIRIPGEAYQVLNVILRKTYGYQKKEDRIALAQFTEATGLKRQHVARSIKKLSELNVITVTNNGATSPATYRINKYSATWNHAPKKVQEVGTKNGDSAGTNNGAKQESKTVQARTNNGADDAPFLGTTKEIEKERKEIKEKTTTTPAAVTVRELSLLFNRYAGANIVGGGQIVVLQDFARDYPRETITEAFQAAAGANVEPRRFLSWCKTRMERRQVQDAQQNEEAQQKKQVAQKIAEIEIGSQWQGRKSKAIYTVTGFYGAFAEVEDAFGEHAPPIEKKNLVDPEKFDRIQGEP